MNFVDDFVSGSATDWTPDKELLFRAEFNKTMEFVAKNFERGFQKEDRNQTPRVRFEAISVGVNLALRVNPELTVSKEQIVRLLDSDQFREWTTSDAANNRIKVEKRIYGVKDYLLNGVLDES
ncbi:hypothetical protein BN1356_01752 [Streptococcus varani]|uniref:Uncharacterized protein n=1 Tax=Streptococcus varani TaxID=1608583 RepID=A0A0E4CT70_9STRE|nr:hypothetical protein [Streptococcus varani]CQR25412.1 hypothetical protein BN1356_01752 [Streptococcus varani]